MPKTKTQYPPTKWPKEQTRPCPSGQCAHRHIRSTGPCTESGCGCHGQKTKKEKR